MEIIGIIFLGFLLGAGSQSARMELKCKEGVQYACKAKEQMHTLKEVKD